jgi:hypothetical protein
MLVALFTGPQGPRKIYERFIDRTYALGSFPTGEGWEGGEEKEKMPYFSSPPP